MELGRCNFRAVDPSVEIDALAALIRDTDEPLLLRALGGNSSWWQSRIVLDAWGALQVSWGNGADYGQHDPETVGVNGQEGTLNQFLNSLGAEEDDDSYLFYNVTGTPQLSNEEYGLPALAPPALLAAIERSWTRSQWQSFTRLSLSRAQAGIGFHFHGPAVNLLLAGRKRWFAFYPLSCPDCAGPAAPRLAMHQWLSTTYPSVQARWLRSGYECTQNAGEVVIMPPEMQHAVLNVEHATAALVFEAYASAGDPLKLYQRMQRGPSRTLLGLENAV